MVIEKGPRERMLELEINQIINIKTIDSLMKENFALCRDLEALKAKVDQHCAIGANPHEV